MPSIAKMLRQLVPQKLKLRYYIHKKLRRRNRPLEKFLLPLMCDRQKAAIDIGANIGTVAYFLSKYSRLTHAFEINPVVADRLKRARLPRTIVHQVGLSDFPHTAKLRVPIEDFGPVFGSGTIENANALDGNPAQEMDVEVATLDGFDIPDVGIIKIDVEGHELAVLRGARRTLEKDRPNLVVEILERLNGNSFSAILDYLGALSYKCYRLGDSGLVEVAAARDEKGNNDYYFLQAEAANKIGKQLRSVSAGRPG